MNYIDISNESKVHLCTMATRVQEIQILSLLPFMSANTPQVNQDYG